MAMQYFLGVVLILACLRVTGLTVTFDAAESGAATTPATYYHLTAEFGPQAGEYSRTGDLVLADPYEYCGNFDRTDCANKIVLIERGNCSFAHKIKAAQDRGAIGVVMGNNDPTNIYQYVKMGTDGTFNASSITIPSVFISTDTYQTLKDGLEEYPDMLVVATLDVNGEVTNVLIYDVDSTTGLFLLILPIMWCATILIYFIRRWYILRRDQRLRTRRNMEIPLVPYAGEEDREIPDFPTEDHKTAAARIHNESCAICLEDFSSGDPIKVLPCAHGFHGPCIDPWLNERSDLCPICKSSIFDSGTSPLTPRAGDQKEGGAAQNSDLDSISVSSEIAATAALLNSGQRSSDSPVDMIDPDSMEDQMHSSARDSGDELPALSVEV